MAFSGIIRLAPMTVVGITSTLIYTCPVATSVRVGKFTATNEANVVVRLQVYLIPSGRSEDTTTILIPWMSIPAYRCVDLSPLFGQVLYPGDVIKMIADTATSIYTQGAGVSFV